MSKLFWVTAVNDLTSQPLVGIVIIIVWKDRHKNWQLFLSQDDVLKIDQLRRIFIIQNDFYNVELPKHACVGRTNFCLFKVVPTYWCKQCSLFIRQTQSLYNQFLPINNLPSYVPIQSFLCLSTPSHCFYIHLGILMLVACRAFIHYHISCELTEWPLCFIITICIFQVYQLAYLKEHEIHNQFSWTWSLQTLWFETKTTL